MLENEKQLWKRETLIGTDFRLIEVSLTKINSGLILTPIKLIQIKKYFDQLIQWIMNILILKWLNWAV